MPSPLTYELRHRDPAGHARLGRVTTPHGGFDTPAFMPVGTKATVKGVLPGQVADSGARILLSNTYHLLLRPGAELVAQMGGLHRWMRWDKPILTDSGGFQVFSLAGINRIDDRGVVFRSHLDGRSVELTPQRSIDTQNKLGADIIMAFDDCPAALEGAMADGGWLMADGKKQDPALPSSHSLHQPSSPPHQPSSITRQPSAAAAAERTIRWLDQCVKAHARRDDQALFGIVQGGTDPALRDWCVERVCAHDLPGYAIGGVAVGEGPDMIRAVVEHTAPKLPEDRPRYLMGVGYERDIVMAVRAGVDMFDCVLPTRNGRNASVFTPAGRLKLRNAKHKTDPAPIQADCDCPACAGGYSRSYLRHLFNTAEMLGPILATLHNLRYFQRLMLDIRGAIVHNGWSDLARRYPVVGRL